MPLLLAACFRWFHCTLKANCSTCSVASERPKRVPIIDSALVLRFISGSGHSSHAPVLYWRRSSVYIA